MGEVEYHRTHFDVLLLFTTILLVGLGIIMVYSSSAVLAQERFGDSYYFLKRTIVFTAFGSLLLLVAARTPYYKLRSLVYPILIGSLFLMGLVFIPGIGRTISGATRWISVGPVAFQPSEVAKIALVIFLAYSMEKKAPKIRSFGVGFAPHVAVMGVVACAILIQKDFGAAATIAAITWMMMFVAGVRLAHLMSLFLFALPLVWWLVGGSGYRRRRVLAFLNPWSDQYGSGFQMIQSYVAFNEGGWIGRGLGEGRQKLFYLPEAHTDFIFSVLGEELGLLGVLVVISLFGFFCYRGLRIAFNAPDAFGRYLAVGCTLLISLEAVLNMGVVMGLLPTKGLPLPFISYGGSSLSASLLAVGILLSVSSYRRVEI
jgi:cell division protein FtsW